MSKKSTVQTKFVQTRRASSLATIALIIICNLSFTIHNSQAQDFGYQCEKGFIRTLGVATGLTIQKEASTFDADGNIYIAGGFSGMVQFGTYTLVSNGGSDMFIVKTDSKGEVLWATSFGGEGGDGINAIEVDSSGNIYVGGGMSSNNFILPDGSTTSCAGAEDILIAKFNSSGVFQWYKHYGAEQYDWFKDLIIDDAQNLYIIGSYRVGITIGSYSLPSNNPSPGGQTDAWDNLFMAKFDPSGNVIWAQRNVNQAGASTRVSGKKFVKDSKGQIYFYAYVTKGSTSIDTVEVVLGGSSSGYLGDFFGKIDTSGAVLWTEMPLLNDPNDPDGLLTRGLYIDKYDNIHLLALAPAGYSNFPIYCSGNTFAFSEGLFKIKYNTDGEALGVISMGGVKTDSNCGFTVNNFTVADDGSVFACGTFELSATFNGTVLTAYDQNDLVPLHDAWFCKYDSTGTFEWAKRMGAPGEGKPSPMTIHYTEDGNIFVAGHYYGYGSTIFDDIPGTTLIGTQSDYALFAMKYREDGKLIDEHFAGIDSTINKCDSVLIGTVSYNDFTYLWTPNHNLVNASDAITYAFPDDNTSYALTAIDIISSCIYYDTVDISVTQPEYALDFTATPRILNGNPPYIVEFTNTTPDITYYDFEWDFGDGNTSSSTNPIHTYTAQGSFDVMLTAALKSNGCSDSIVKSGYISGFPDAISEIDGSMFNISPNPSNGEFTIEIGSFVERSRNTETIIEIFTIDGKMVYNENINVETRHASSKQISTDLNKGMYFIKISSDGKGEKSFAITKKIIIN